MTFRCKNVHIVIYVFATFDYRSYSNLMKAENMTSNQVYNIDLLQTITVVIHVHN